MVAHIGDRTVTLGELDEAVAGKLMKLQRQRAEQEYKIRQAGLDDLINGRLIAQEAKRQGIPEEALLRAEVENKTSALTDAEVKAFYDANTSRISSPFSQVQSRLKEYLQQERTRQRFRAYVETLRSAARVSITLPPPALPRIQSVPPDFQETFRPSGHTSTSSTSVIRDCSSRM